MPDYLDDLDADFLAVYGIDLWTEDIPAQRFFALAQRTAAYQGAMQARLSEEQERSSSGGPHRQQEVSVDQMGLVAPGLIERVEV